MLKPKYEKRFKNVKGNFYLFFEKCGIKEWECVKNFEKMQNKRM